MLRFRKMKPSDTDKTDWTNEPLAALLPEGAVRILACADPDTIRERFKARMHGNLPEPVARMLEKKHGMFDGAEYDYRFDSTKDDAAELCERLKKRLEEPWQT